MRGRAVGAVMVLTLAAIWPGAVDAQPGVQTGQPAPEIAGGPWINSEPLSLEQVRGRVLFVEFWTYGCYNCKNVIPHLRDWHAKYERQGLIIIGVHTPEFSWERPYDKVAAATRELGIRYPVVQDNNYAIWRRYRNWAWPTAVLVDRKGVVRYTHVGEGAYVRTEHVIRQLLTEP
jgi:thiol-disulfide isomerase/thioredoxin